MDDCRLIFVWRGAGCLSLLERLCRAGRAFEVSDCSYVFGHICPFISVYVLRRKPPRSFRYLGKSWIFGRVIRMSKTKFCLSKPMKFEIDCLSLRSTKRIESASGLHFIPPLRPFLPSQKTIKVNETAMVTPNLLHHMCILDPEAKFRVSHC